MVLGKGPRKKNGFEMKHEQQIDASDPMPKSELLSLPFGRTSWRFDFLYQNNANKPKIIVIFFWVKRL